MLAAEPRLRAHGQSESKFLRPKVQFDSTHHPDWR